MKIAILHNNRTLKFALIAFLIIFALFCCVFIWVVVANISNKNLGQNPQNYSKTLYVYPGAHGIKYSKQIGQEFVGYHITMKYPAEPFISSMSTHLSNLGYTPLKGDYLIQGTTSSFIRGWNEAYLISSNQGTKIVQGFSTHWEAKDHSVVYCIINYTSSTVQLSNASDLNVGLSYIAPSRVQFDRIQVIPMKIQNKIDSLFP